MNQRFLILLFLFQILCISTFSQAVPHSVNNRGIYDFLDELANIHIIEIYSAIKPYSRMYIAERLDEADARREELSKRQCQELDFYMMDFGTEDTSTSLSMKGAGAQGRRGATAKSGGEGETEGLRDEETAGPQDLKSERSGDPASVGTARHLLRRDLLYYRDSLFSLTINPILGGEVFTNSAGKATNWRNGIEARAYIGKWGFYGSLLDNHEKPLIGKPDYLTQREGGHIKGGTDWSEMQGGVTYAWLWGDAGLIKDKVQWGSNYNGANIFGGNNPTFVQFKIHISPVKWFDFNYFHGWLNSQVVDSTESYWVTNSYGNDYREVYHKKFMSANMFTFTPVRNLNVSVGNSIIYSDENVNPAYLIPLFFYKSVDHSLTSGIDNMNSQMFMDISSRQIKHLHLYATMFIDELSVSRFTKNDEWNFFSYKAGFRLTDMPVENLSFTTEFTYTYPLVFQHYVPTLTFETSGFNLGHYMKDNSREWYMAFDYRPVRTLHVNLFLLDAIRGPDYTELGTDRLGNPPLESVEWHDTSFGIKASYQLINDLYMWASFTSSDIGGDIRWSADYFYGKKRTLNCGVSIGF